MSQHIGLESADITIQNLLIITNKQKLSTQHAFR